MKSLKELTEGPSSWPIIKELIDGAVNDCELLPKDKRTADEALLSLQQSVKSLMGAVTYETGGILIDGGWLRILGSGHEKLTRTIASWNLSRSHETPDETPGFLMVADDVLSGIFAVNGGELGDDIGNIYYLAPDTLEWEAMEVTYHEFINFCLTGDVSKFYENLRWDGWREEIAKLDGDQALTIIPPLWAEGPDNILERERIPIPMDEAYDIALDMNNLLYGELDAPLENEEHKHDDGCGCDDESCGCGDESCGGEHD